MRVRCPSHRRTRATRIVLAAWWRQGSGARNDYTLDYLARAHQRVAVVSSKLLPRIGWVLESPQLVAFTSLRLQLLPRHPDPQRSHLREVSVQGDRSVFDSLGEPLGEDLHQRACARGGWRGFIIHHGGGPASRQRLTSTDRLNPPGSGCSAGARRSGRVALDQHHPWDSGVVQRPKNAALMIASSSGSS
jgi:hypothetical protein